MRKIQKIDGIAVSIITKIAGRSKSIFAKRKRHMFDDALSGGTSHVSANLEELGTLAGNATLVNGVLVCNANNDFTSIPMSNDFKSSVNQTISFWFKTTFNPLSGNWMRFVHTHVIGGGQNGFFIEMRSPTKIFFKGASQGLLADGDPTAIAPYALNDGNWHQITVAWQNLGSEVLKIWVDGQPITVLNQTHVGSGADNKSTLYIGAKQFNSPMEMDKVSITEEFIDDSEALARYNSEKIVESTYLEQEATLFGDAQLINSALILDGWQDYGIIDNGFRYTDKMSTSIWFKTSQAVGETFLYSSYVQNNTQPANGFSASLSSGTIKFQHPSLGVGNLTGPSGLNDGQWHHMVLTWEELVGYNLYIDGSQVRSGVANNNSHGYVENWPLYIGAQGRDGLNPIGFWNGEVKKFEIINDVLTAQQVLDIYNSN